MRAEGFFCNLDILYGLGISKLQFLIKKFFFQFLVIKALDPDPDPDPYWYPTSTSGSGSGKNEYGSETLLFRWQKKVISCSLHLRNRKRKIKNHTNIEREKEKNVRAENGKVREKNFWNRAPMARREKN